MSEAIILGAIQKLQNLLVETPSINPHHEWILKEVINELRMMLDFLRDKESGERSSLNYLLADFAEMAQVTADLIRDFGHYYYYFEDKRSLDLLSKMKKRMMEFGVGEGVSGPQSVAEEGEKGVVVGLDKDVQQLIGKVILNEKSGLVTSCIKGMLGVGKTTLATQVYNHPAIIEKFKRRRAWVSISSDTSMHEVLVELIQQLVEVDGDSLLVEEMDNHSLQQMLRKNLQGIPYFVVVDNLLPEMRLQSILDGLPDEGHGSRLLFTCRYQVITTCISYSHEMKALDSDKSWQLFLNTIFHGDKFTSDENKFSKELERKGREMLKKCGGLPVAIIDVGRQKAKQRLSGMEWEEIFDSIDLGESLKLLEPMYHNLDEELKACFLYMSFFKENAIMREEKLEQIWAANGVDTESDVSITHDLRSHSIIEGVNKRSIYLETKKCRLNPLLHMLSIKKAEDEIGFEILRSNGNNRPSQNPRHRVIHCGRDKFNHSTDQDKHLVSLIFHGGGRYLDDASQSYWKSFELLKILDVEDFGVKTLSETIGTLIELRYLGLRNNYIQEIPHSLGGLKKLETLDIAKNFMVEVPDIIKEMSSLCHLYMSDVIHQKPFKVDALQNLETLAYISIYDWAYEVSVMETMTHLRKLGIEEVDENSNVGKLFASLAKLERLQHLILRGFRFRSTPYLDEIDVLKGLRAIKLDGLLSRLPSADSFPRDINYLVLVNTCLDEDPMLVLEKLPDLRHLKLRNAYTGREMVIQQSGFRRLETLCISELWNLRNVQVGEGAMSKLNQLEIKNCPHLETFPQVIGSMEYLKKFRMVTTKHIATKIKGSGLTSKVVEVDISP